MSDIFQTRESNVRSYCRSFPLEVAKARGAELFTASGERYIDFLAGAGALNYGHNCPPIQESVVRYLLDGGIVQGLDLHTTAKRRFLETFDELVLSKLSASYKVQFCGPTGTDAVEAALRLARKAKQRSGIFAFSGSYHGMTMGSLAVSSNAFYRSSVPRQIADVHFIPFPSRYNEHVESIRYLEQILTDSHSGYDIPAAVIIEAVQGEGGVNVAPAAWLRELRSLCDRFDILLIIDDVQAGCYRTGDFFSFEEAGITPDLVVLSKSISGLGLPMALLLIRDGLDCWEPGEFIGTFRGNQLALVAGEAALRYAAENDFRSMIRERSQIVETTLVGPIASDDPRIRIRGRGMIWGVDLADIVPAGAAGRVSRNCFQHGLVIETAGRGDSVVKLLPPLNIDLAILREGLKILGDAVATVLSGEDSDSQPIREETY